MKKLGFLVLSAMIALGIFAVPVKAAAAEKFGYVSIERVGDAYLKAKEYMKVLEGKEAAYTKEIDKKRDEIKAFQDKINMLSEKERDAKSAELEAKIKTFQDFVRQKESDLRKEQVDKTIELSKDIKAAIDKYSSKENFTMVFDAAALAYQPKNMDITDKVIDILNKEYKK
ncbi:MAG: OmpH family outer membrane protein [Candidatus Omnitrophica bacterium]|nr:OmpH family outer membrane protein [Candidatus Omnitrophota bacterium]MDD5512578.1 OmpH family outer membrane protein [Candidatus Omnitrophota bacterium]